MKTITTMEQVQSYLLDGTARYVKVLAANPARVALEIEYNGVAGNVYIANGDAAGDGSAKKFPFGMVRRWDRYVHKGEVWARSDTAGASVTISETVQREEL